VNGGGFCHLDGDDGDGAGDDEVWVWRSLQVDV